MKKAFCCLLLLVCCWFLYGQNGSYPSLDSLRNVEFIKIVNRGDSCFKMKNEMGAKMYWEMAQLYKEDCDLLQRMGWVTASAPRCPDSLDRAYINLMLLGEFGISVKKYEEAKKAFEDALKMRPEESFPKEQIEKCEKLFREHSETVLREFTALFSQPFQFDRVVAYPIRLGAVTTLYRNRETVLQADTSEKKVITIGQLSQLLQLFRDPGTFQDCQPTKCFETTLALVFYQGNSISAFIQTTTYECHGLSAHPRLNIEVTRCPEGPSYIMLSKEGAKKFIAWYEQAGLSGFEKK